MTMVCGKKADLKLCLLSFQPLQYLDRGGGRLGVLQSGEGHRLSLRHVEADKVFALSPATAFPQHLQSDLRHSVCQLLGRSSSLIQHHRSIRPRRILLSRSRTRQQVLSVCFDRCRQISNCLTVKLRERSGIDPFLHYRTKRVRLEPTCYVSHARLLGVAAVLLAFLDLYTLQM